MLLSLRRWLSKMENSLVLFFRPLMGSLEFNLHSIFFLVLGMKAHFLMQYNKEEIMRKAVREKRAEQKGRR
jgi:hypothetical protein